VGEAIEAGWRVETILYAPEHLSSDYAQKLLEEAERRKIRCAALSPELFGSIAEKDNPQGILAVVGKRHLTLEELDKEQFRFGVALVSPQDPGNVGTILRTIDAAGADGLFLLDGGVDPTHPSCVRASMGTIFWKPFVQISFDQFRSWARESGFQLVGSSAHAQEDHRGFKRGSQPTILILGSEQKGLSQEQLNACDLNVRLPMLGRASSLNLAVAAGILLYSMMDN
jgi:RNA methyltransferase, TrmH family